MRIMKYSAESKLRLQRENCINDLRRIPLMDHHDVGSAQFPAGKFLEFTTLVIETDVQHRESTTKADHCFCRSAIGFCGQVLHGPGIAFFVTADFVSQLHKLAGEAAK